MSQLNVQCQDSLGIPVYLEVCEGELSCMNF